MRKYIGKIKIKNPNRMIEFKKLNNYANFTSKHCRWKYERYCENLPNIINKIKRENPDIEINFEFEQIK